METQTLGSSYRTAPLGDGDDNEGHPIEDYPTYSDIQPLDIENAGAAEHNPPSFTDVVMDNRSPRDFAPPNPRASAANTTASTVDWGLPMGDSTEDLTASATDSVDIRSHIRRFTSRSWLPPPPLPDKLSLMSRETRRSIRRACCSTLHYKIWVVIIAFWIFVLLALLIAVIIYIPPYVQEQFAGYGGSDWPLMEFRNFTNDGFIINTDYMLPFTSYFDTRIEFEDEMTFTLADTNQTILRLDFPDMNVGWNRAHHLKGPLRFTILDTDEWVRLWKQWIVSAVDQNVPYRVKPATLWKIEAPVRVSMLGLTWRNILLENSMEFSGGLSGSGGSLMNVNVSDWSLLPSWTRPGLNITMTYNNQKDISVHFGDFQFSAYSVYRKNETYSTPVRILDVRFPDFTFKKGVHNVTISNEFQLDQPSSISSSFQILTNVFRKRTSLIIFQDFRSYFDGQIVGWLDSIFGFLQFLIRLEPRQSIWETIRNSRKEGNDAFDTTVDRIEDSTTGRRRDRNGGADDPWSDEFDPDSITENE